MRTALNLMMLAALIMGGSFAKAQGVIANGPAPFPAPTVWSPTF